MLVEGDMLEDKLKVDVLLKKGNLLTMAKISYKKSYFYLNYVYLKF